MGFMSAYDGTFKVPIPHPEKEYWVELRKHLTHGATEKSTAALQSLNMVDGKPVPAPDVFKSQTEKVLASIVDWNIGAGDEHGIWPINVQSVRRLPDVVFELLHNAMEESNKPRPPAEQARFPVEDVVGDPDGDAGAAVPVDAPDEAGVLAAPGDEG